MKKIKSVGAVFFACLIMFTIVMGIASPAVVMADNVVVKKETEEETTIKEDLEYREGDANDIKIEEVNTMGASAGGVAGIEFRTTLDSNYVGKNAKIKSIRPKMDTAGPFVVDDCMHVIAKPDPKEDDEDETRSMKRGFVFNVKGDIATGYYPIAFEIEYIKNNVTYRVDKSIDIALFGNEETTESSETNGSVPRIIVTGFETNPEKVMAGQEFELTVHLQNTSNTTAVSNIKVSLNTEGNEFLPSSGSSTQFIRSISCGATTDVVMMMKAQGNLEQKPYVLNVECEYEGANNTAYTATENISVPVYQEAKAKITDVEVMPASIETYSQANVMFSINNTGKSTLYNVQVSIDESCTTLEKIESFVGNIEPGSTGYADFMVTGTAPTTDDGNVKLIVSYEDSSGEIGTFETTINLFVFEPMEEMGGMEEVSLPIDSEMEEGSKSDGASWIWLAVGFVVVVVVIIITVVVIKAKKRKALEEELEDEIS